MSDKDRGVDERHDEHRYRNSQRRTSRKRTTVYLAVQTWSNGVAQLTDNTNRRGVHNYVKSL